MIRTLTVAIACAGLLGACQAKKQSPEFEKRWKEAKAKSGLEEVQVIDTRRSGLKGNVQRLGEPTPPAFSGVGSERPLTLSQNQVGRHIRRQLARLNTCYQTAKGKSGRAMVTVKIMPSGRVDEVEVDAPAFSGTRLASCLRKGAMRWSFPRFQQGPLTYTYPFIFR